MKSEPPWGHPCLKGISELILSILLCQQVAVLSSLHHFPHLHYLHLFLPLAETWLHVSFIIHKTKPNKYWSLTAYAKTYLNLFVATISMFLLPIPQVPLSKDNCCRPSSVYKERVFLNVFLLHKNFSNHAPWNMSYS